MIPAPPSTYAIVGRWLTPLPAALLACSLIDDLDELSSVPLETAGSGGSADEQGGSAGNDGEAGSDVGDTGGAGGSEAGASGAGGAGIGGTGTGGSEAGASGAGGSSSLDAGTQGATRIFWLERGAKTVNVVNADGSGRVAVITVTGGAGSSITGIAVDPVNAQLYYTDDARRRVQRANLDGTNEVTVLPGIDSPFGVDVDPSGGVFYVARKGVTSSVERANLDGTGLAALISTGLESPYGLAVYPAAGKLYVVDDSLDAVLSSDLDGSNLTNLNVAGVIDPVDISIDTLEDMLYWSERGASGPRIRRANLDGSGVEDVVTSTSLPGFSAAAGLEVDVAGRVLYFVDGGSGGSILRCNLDGSNPTPFLTGLNDPTGVTLTGP